MPGKLKTKMNNLIKLLTGTPGFVHTTQLPAHRIFCGRNEKNGFSDNSAPRICLQILSHVIILIRACVVNEQSTKAFNGLNMSTKRPAYQPFEARLIQLLKRCLKKSKIRVRDYQKVGKLPLEIDMVALPPEQDWIPDFAIFPRLFEHFRRYNVMEVKTAQDRLASEDLTKLMAYGWLYMSKHGLVNPSEVTLTALVHHLPSKTLEALPKLGFATKAQGIYWRDAEPVAYVISFTDLPDELVPEELRIFCDAARRRQTFLACLGDEEKAPIVETIIDLFESEVKNIMLKIREETLRNILSVVDEKRIVAALGEEKIISALGKKKIVAALKKLPVEDRLKGLPAETLLRNLSAEEIEAYLKKLRKRKQKKQATKTVAGSIWGAR